MQSLTFAAGTLEKVCALMCSILEQETALGQVRPGGGLKQKAPGAEVGCKNALFVAVARGTLLQVARGTSLQVARETSLQVA